MYKINLTLHELRVIIGALEYEMLEWFPAGSIGQKERKEIQEKLEKLLD
ncbi:hypothetical protein LCGC14_1849400 [marine sediment metagenome]|uniref:Uncharacterized protein n=1 Tax=marine sediment metagenome TaxID=412755 RepID=A0A0F9IQC4_9ZZZZ